MALVVKNPPVKAGDIRDVGSISGSTSRKTPWRRSWQPTPVFLPGESPWTEEPNGLQSIESQRVGHNWSDLARIGSEQAKANWEGWDPADAIYIHTSRLDCNQAQPAWLKISLSTGMSHMQMRILMVSCKTTFSLVCVALPFESQSPQGGPNTA